MMVRFKDHPWDCSCRECGGAGRGAGADADKNQLDKDTPQPPNAVPSCAGTAQIPVPEEREDVARAVKALRLLGTARRMADQRLSLMRFTGMVVDDFTLEDIANEMETWDEDGWKEMADKARVRLPSLRTRRLAIGILRSGVFGK